MQENAELYLKRREERREQQAHEAAERSKVKCGNEKSKRYVLKNRRTALEEIFRTLLLTVDYASSQGPAEVQGDDEERAGRGAGDPQHWQIMKSEGEEAYELCLQDSLCQEAAWRGQEGDPEETITVESSLTDPGDSPTVSRNLIRVFEQPEMREGTRESSPTSAASRPPPSLQQPRPGDGVRQRDEEKQRHSEPSANFYFRGERLANAKQRSPQPAQPQLTVETSPSLHPASPAERKERKPLLLDTSRAMPEMLKPSSICQAVTMVLEVSPSLRLLS
jgi:hypothetical protein